MGKIFININRFEDYYDMNFDKSINHYDFYLTHLKKFLGLVRRSTRPINAVNSSSFNAEESTNSIRVSEYLNRVSSQRPLE